MFLLPTTSGRFREAAYCRAQWPPSVQLRTLAPLEISISTIFKWPAEDAIINGVHPDLNNNIKKNSCLALKKTSQVYYLNKTYIIW